ncbi:MAG: PDZ domain-containing protein [Candidatus Eisenbacteria bacterium]
MKSTKLTGLLAVVALAGLTAWGAHAGGAFSDCSSKASCNRSGSATQASVCPGMTQSGSTSAAAEFVPVCSGSDAKGTQARAVCGGSKGAMKAGSGCADGEKTAMETSGGSSCCAGKGAGAQANAGGGCPYMGAMAVCSHDGVVCDSNTADCEQMLRTYYANHGWLGVEMICAANGTCQPTVTRVDAGSPAEKAGFQVGDVLTSLNGIAFTAENAEAVGKLMNEGFKSGDKVRYTAAREGKTVDLQAKLAKIDDARLAEMIQAHVSTHQPAERPAAKTSDKAESVRS